MNDLIHCDANDLIKKVTFLEENFLLCAHDKCLNVWSLKKDEDKTTNKTNHESNLIKSGNAFDDIKCVWSAQVDDVLEISENPMQKSQFVIFIKTKSGQVKHSNEPTSSEIKSKL